MKNFIFLFLLSIRSSVYAQELWKKNIDLSAYLESYYSYDFHNPPNHTRPSFIYSHHRHNEFNINLAFLKAKYERKNTRANLALMTGTYAQANLASEPALFRNIFEANAGVKLSKNKNLWLDAGIMPSHIGMESAIGKDCWALTRSMAADNSPYYETGAKVTYQSSNDKLLLSLLVLNGWQKIQRNNGSSSPAFGHQLTYKPTEKFLINSSSYIGKEFADSISCMRYFHNAYTQINLHKKFAVQIGFDIGVQQKSKGSSAYDIWYTSLVQAKFSPNRKIDIAARAEYYNDADGVIISYISPNGFQTSGASVNFDFHIMQDVLWRTEMRMLQSRDAIFVDGKTNTRENYFATTALTISF